MAGGYVMGDTPSFPFGMNLSQIITLGVVLAGFVGSAYVSNYKIGEIEASMGDFRKMLLEHQQVIERQAEFGRRIDRLEERLQRQEDRR